MAFFHDSFTPEGQDRHPLQPTPRSNGKSSLPGRGDERVRTQARSAADCRSSGISALALPLPTENSPPPE
jgi:hypothetical protein